MRTVREFCLMGVLVLLCGLSGYAQVPPGPVSKEHNLFDGPESCTVCHDFVKGKPEFKCLTCHGSVMEDQKSGRHPKLGDDIKSNVCAGCHTLHIQAGTGSGDPEKQLTKAGSPHGTIGIACRNCHTSTSYRPIRPFPDFKHSETVYPLRGMHVGLECRQCHATLVFSNAGRQCADCHADFHRRRMGSDCGQCHSVRGWRVSLTAVKDHTNRFPLMGAHTAVDCESCHKNAAVGLFRGVSTDCASCHLREYTAVNSPDHRAAGFLTTCQSCHTMDSWSGVTFDHGKYTGFLLTGEHARLDCTACHENRKYAGLSTACESCHMTDYNGTTDPNHAQAGLPQQCSTCHSTASWTGASFNHGATSFPLTGAHSSAQCETCHKNNVYAGLPTACESCHMADYNGTTDPNHAQAGLPQDCSLCHSTTGFSGATFNHGATPFPLTGAHVGVTCTSCHKNNVYAGLATACESCHMTDYSGTTNPNHTQAGLPQQCSICHNTTSWAGAAFNHSTTPFPLTGAHVTVQCNLCHISDRYAGTPTDCYPCHSAEYKGTTNPGHPAAGFPTTCETCHTTASWTGATFNHPWWQTNHGNARTCGDCHTNPSDYSVFSCTICHAKAQTDSSHSGRSGYVYNSANCYQCHGSGGD